jgi:HEPN domain-containing protein
MKTMTLEWVSKAEGDYDVVAVLRRSRKRTRFDTICFHCQQCAEKYIKARLHESGIYFDKTHDLVRLVKLTERIEPLWIGMSPALKNLTEYAVEVRYPGNTATSKQARESFGTCTMLSSLARASLGLKQ